jgi:crotonobetainyl-CoA:carnitine CoA-transferase CaiB-like acyl-CoA transferase
MTSSKPLDGFTVVDFSQFLSGPSASLRLADLGARVIKIERPVTGDICRHLYISNVVLDGDSTTFHSINRNKESFAADLKCESDRESVRKLLTKADVVLHNFRPGVMERLGFGYSSVRALNDSIIYGTVSGYGVDGPWNHKPGQDLLLQSITGLTWLSGNAGDGPVPMGLSICDMLAGAQLAQGVLACILRRSLTGMGGLVEVSMLEASLDFQFEAFTTYLQDGGEEPVRTALSNAHAYLGAPYGIYATEDGFLALAMNNIVRLGELLQCAHLLVFQDPTSWFDQRDEIKAELSRHLRTQTTTYWLAILEPADIWCAEVLDWNQFTTHPAYHALDMEQTVYRKDGLAMKTTRLPMRFNGERFTSSVGSPKVGEHTEKIMRELIL